MKPTVQIGKEISVNETKRPVVMKLISLQGLDEALQD